MESKGSDDRLTWIPAREKSDLSACISWLTNSVPLA